MLSPEIKGPGSKFERRQALNSSVVLSVDLILHHYCEVIRSPQAMPACHAQPHRESATRALLPRFIACRYTACLPMNTVHSIATTRCFLELNGAHHEPHFPNPLPRRIGRDGSGCEPVVRDHCGCRAGDVRLSHTRCVDHAADRAGACDDHCFEVGLTRYPSSVLSRRCAL